MGSFCEYAFFVQCQAMALRGREGARRDDGLPIADFQLPIDGGAMAGHRAFAAAFGRRIEGDVADERPCTECLFIELGG
jgi:hypothetical protein